MEPMKVDGVEEIQFYYAGTGERIYVRHPVETCTDKENLLRQYNCRNGTHVIVRNTWDVCTIVPTVLVEQEVEEEGGG